MLFAWRNMGKNNRRLEKGDKRREIILDHGRL